MNLRLSKSFPRKQSPWKTTVLKNCLNVLPPWKNENTPCTYSAAGGGHTEVGYGLAFAEGSRAGSRFPQRPGRMDVHVCKHGRMALLQQGLSPEIRKRAK